MNERTHEPCGCAGEVRFRALYERYRGYMERIARGDSYGATLAREALEVALDPEPEVVALRAEVASLRRQNEDAGGIIGCLSEDKRRAEAEVSRLRAVIAEGLRDMERVSKALGEVDRA